MSRTSCAPRSTAFPTSLAINSSAWGPIRGSVSSLRSRSCSASCFLVWSRNSLRFRSIAARTASALNVVALKLTALPASDASSDQRARRGRVQAPFRAVLRRVAAFSSAACSFGVPAVRQHRAVAQSAKHKPISKTARRAGAFRRGQTVVNLDSGGQRQAKRRRLSCPGLPRTQTALRRGRAHRRRPRVRGSMQRLGGDRALSVPASVPGAPRGPARGAGVKPGRFVH